MKIRKFSIATTATVAITCAAAFTPPGGVSPARGTVHKSDDDECHSGWWQLRHPQGKIQALDPGAMTLTIVPESSPPVPMTVAPAVDLTSISVGDVADVHYTRSVTFVVGSPNVVVAQVPATNSVGQVAQTPGGIGPSAAVIVGRVVKLNGPISFDVVNASGGGVYTIKTTNPTREAAIGLLKVGDSITVSVSPIIVTSVAKCGLFGKGLFGC